MSIVKTISPRGELEWVTITGEGKENMSGKLQYVANLVLDPENNEADAAYLAEIEQFWEDNKPPRFKKPAKSMGSYPHKVKGDDTDEEGKPIYVEDGKVYLAFKTGTTYQDGSDKVVKIYNSKGKEVNFTGAIGNGTLGNISGAMGIYLAKDPKGKTVIDAGVTLYLDAIKISKLVEFVQDAGFEADEEEGGWDGEGDFEGDAAKEAVSDGPAKPRL